jgi:hypothetical protein
MDPLAAHQRAQDAFSRVLAAQAVFAGPGGMTALFGLAIGQVPGSAFIRMRTGRREAAVRLTDSGMVRAPGGWLTCQAC